MLCACLTIIFSGWEGYSFTFAPSVTARVCVGMHVCVEGRVNVSLAAVASACESSFSLLNPGYNSVEDC